MARQTGLIKIKGTLDNVNFYKTKDGDLARMKTTVDADRIKNDPSYERTRENNAEFGNAANAGKIVRDAVRPMSLNASDGKIVSRFTQIMSKIKNLDTNSIRGKRNVGEGILDPNALILIKGIEFNKEALLSAVLYKSFTVDTVTGEIVITDLTPQMDIVSPQGATHIQFTSGFASVDFVTGDKDLQMSAPYNLPIDGSLSTVILTPIATPVVAGTNLFLLKVEFFQEVNGVQYTLKNGAYNALKIVEVQ